MTAPRRQEALEVLLEPVPRDHTVVFANGYIALGGVSARPGSPDFPMLGSMGLAASIGAGLLWRRPDRPVMVVDGDGNVLMGLSALPVVGALGAGSFVHAILDDGVYASTGGQPTSFPAVDMCAVALACGYTSASRPDGPEEISACVRNAWAAPGAHLVHVRLSPCGEDPHKRVADAPADIADTVRAAHAQHGVGSGARSRPSAARNVSLPLARDD